MKKEEFREIRQFFEMSQEKFAHHIGKSFNTINCYENGKRDIPQNMSMLMKLLKKEKMKDKNKNV